MAHPAEQPFIEHRRLLHAVAYRILGRVVDAEDVVQDAWLRWSRVDPATVGDAEGYLVRVTIRLAIDRLRSARARRESYVGQWLPEPLLTDVDAAEDVGLAESVSTALLVVLEELSPVERAVFVLREAFGYRHAEIAELIGRSEAAVRQVAHRAKVAVKARQHRYDTDPVTRRRVTERFLAAADGGDLRALVELLAPDVTMISDGGGFNNAPRKPVHGADRVARAFLRLSRQSPEGATIELRPVNGGPGVVGYAADGRPYLAITLHLAGGVIATLHVVSNPEKLTGVAK